MKMKKFVSLGVVLMATLALTACKSKGPDVEPVALLPEGATLVVNADFSDGDQRDNLRGILKQFPDMKLEEKISTAMNEELAENNLTYEDDVKPIFEGEWEVAMSFAFDPEDISAEPIVYVVAKVAEDKKLRKLIESDASNENLVVSEEGDFTYWTDEVGAMYAGNLGEYFFISASEEGRAQIVANLEEPKESTVDLVEKDKLVSVYVDMSTVLEIFAGAEEVDSTNNPAVELFENYGKMVASISAEKDGIAFDSNIDFSNADEKFVDLMGLNGELTLIDKLNGAGTIFYAEQAKFAGLNVLMGYDMPIETPPTVGDDTSLRGTVDSIVNNPNQILASELREEGAKFFGITPAEFDELFNANIAFRMGYAGNYIPELGLFVDMSEVDEDAAKKIVDTLDIYFKQLETEFATIAESQPELKGALKKDVVNVAGGGLHRLYIDTSAIPAEVRQQVEMFGLKDPKFELYYGLTGDGVLAVALHPDFAVTYGKDTLSDDEAFKAAVGKIGGADGYAVSYVATAPLVGLINEWVMFAEKTGAVPASAKTEINLYVNQVLAASRYVVSVNEYVDGENVAKGFVKIKKPDVAEEKAE